MTGIRVTPIFQSLNAVRSSPRTALASRYAQQSRLYASQGYGSGQGDPKGENPSDQGPNLSVDLEHPGPPPPDVGKGTGGGPTKAAGKSDQNSQQKSPSGGQPTKSQGGGKEGTSGAQPKILQNDLPPEGDQSAEVKAHNKDMSKRHDKPQEKSDG